MADARRLGWVDTAKGISIILVVMMYSAYSVGEDTGGIGWLHHIIAFATPFRMPEFFLISGLFLMKVIDRDWPRFADRRVAHYLYFYLLWAVIHILFKSAVAQGDPVGALQLMAISLVQPYGVLWFIYVLALFGAAAKLLHTARVPLWAGLAIGAALQIAPIATGSYAVDQFAEHFVYFYAGYALAPRIFALVEWMAERPLVAMASLAAWATANALLVFSPGHSFGPDHFEMGLAGLPVLHLLLALAGGLAICIASALLARVPMMDWLRWLGEHSIVIYLAFPLPMSAARIALLRTELVTDPNMLGLVVFAVAMVSPVLLYAAIKWSGFGGFLFERPGWAHLPGTAASRPAPPAPARVPAE